MLVSSGVALCQIFHANPAAEAAKIIAAVRTRRFLDRYEEAIGTNGLATGDAAGTTYITASADDVMSNRSTLTVTAEPTYVTGVVDVRGAAISGATVTLVDSSGAVSAATTTGSDGTYSVASTGMTPPFLIHASLSGQSLYSMSADSNGAATTATSGTIEIPNCNFGATNHVNIQVEITGMNGEDSESIVLLK